MQLLFLTGAAMVAFAANSVLARLALADGSLDAGSYTFTRIASGAILLLFLVWRTHGRAAFQPRGDWTSGLALLVYAAGFSFAYLALGTGTGALILFACVQATMIVWGLIKGERPVWLEWIGLVVAFGALIWLVSPGISAPDPLGATLMAAAGVAWGVYSLRGRQQGDPLLATSGNFVRATPIALVIVIAGSQSISITATGLVLAVISGAITSGLGYALWYRVLKHLTATRAAIVQLSVPALAAIGGVILNGESITLRFAVSSVLILGGVAIAILARQRRN